MSANPHLLVIHHNFQAPKSPNTFFTFYIVCASKNGNLWKALCDVKSDVNQVTCNDLYLTWLLKYFHTLFFFLSSTFEDVCSVSAVFLEPSLCFVCSVTTTNQGSPAALLVLCPFQLADEGCYDDLALLLLADFCMGASVHVVRLQERLVRISAH